jgi:hypothetical protein
LSRYHGDFSAGKTVRIMFNTNDGSGAPITLAGSPVCRVYKDSGTTQHGTTYTPAVDFDALTGLHEVAIDTGADGTFYSAGSDFRVVLQAGMVDGTSVVGVLVGSFSIGNRSALRPTTADRTLDVSAGGDASVDLGVRAPASWIDAAAFAADVPSSAPSEIGDAVRTELAAELAFLDAAVSTRAPSATALSNAMWTDTKAGYLDAAVTSRAPSATALSTATWTSTKAGYLDAAISGVSTGGVSAEDIAAAVWAAAPAGTPPSEIGDAVVTAITGSSAFVDLVEDTVWNAPGPDHELAGSMGEYLGDAAAGTGGGGGISAADVWAYATRTLSSGANIVLAKGTGITGLNDLSAAQVNAEADAALADAGVTPTVTGRIDAAVSTRAPSSTALSNAVWTDAKAGFIDASILSVSTGGVSPEDIATAVVGAMGTVDAHVLTIADGAITAASIATDAITSSKLAADAIGASEISSTAVTKIQLGLSTYAGADTPGTATLLTRVAGTAPTAAEVAAVKADTAAIKLKTDNLPASPAAVGSSMGTVTAVTGAVASVTAPVTVSGTVNATLVSTGLDAIPVTLTGAPSNFREWLVWLTLRFRRTRKDKTTGAITVYGSTGSGVITTQATADTDTEQTVGVTS